MLNLEEIKQLCRTPSGHEIEYPPLAVKDGKYILAPETYNILAKRANYCNALVMELEAARAVIKKLSENTTLRL
jgi:hypothetical protein